MRDNERHHNIKVISNLTAQYTDGCGIRDGYNAPVVEEPTGGRIGLWRERRATEARWGSWGRWPGMNAVIGFYWRDAS